MGFKLRRRSVYVGTIVAVLAMMGGFALASGLFGAFTTVNVNGNQGSITSGNTIYSPGVTGSSYTVGSGGVGGVCTAPSSSSVLTTVTVTMWVAGGAGACTITVDYVVSLTFTSGTLAASTTYTDGFVVSSEFGGAVTYTTGSATSSCVLGAGQTVCKTVVNIDTGIAATASQPAVNSIQVTVTGS